MRLFRYILIAIVLPISLLANEKKVLVEIFTNSGCAACVPAHEALNSYLSGSNGNKVDFIYYHIEWPVPEDKLYTFNISDSKAKNSFYGPYFASPQVFFNGKHVSLSYTQWENELNSMVENEMDIEIELSGNRKSASFELIANVSNLGSIEADGITINYVIVEDVEYQGTNGIKNHKNVMRKIYNPQGTVLNFNSEGLAKNSTIMAYNNSWDIEKLRIVAFVQNKDSKEVYRSTSLAFSDLIITNIENEKEVPNTFALEQNYPNPFNPTTKIQYSIPLAALSSVEVQKVSLTVYDALGREVATLVNVNQEAGNYEIVWKADKYAGGIYYYQLKAGDLIKTNKMILLK